MVNKHFDGLTEAQMRLLEPFLPKDPEKRKKGYPHAPWKSICNTIFWILITGSRWCDVPKGSQWGSKSASHRWLGKWQQDGTLDRMLQALLNTAELSDMLNWKRLAADGFFFSGKRGRRRN
jgi:transposase